MTLSEEEMRLLGSPKDNNAFYTVAMGMTGEWRLRGTQPCNQPRGPLWRSRMSPTALPSGNRLSGNSVRTLNRNASAVKRLASGAPAFFVLSAYWP
jgi:hypothetical protein